MSPFFVPFKMDSMQSYGTVYTERQKDKIPLTKMVTLTVRVKSLNAVVFHYRPQRSCKGYVFTGMCLSTGGGGYAPRGCLVLGSLGLG